MPHSLIPQRLSLNIFATFLVIGAYVPFLPVWLEGRGISKEEIGLIFAIALWAKIPVGLLVASIADQTGDRKITLIVISLVTLLGFCTFSLLQGFWQLLIAWAIVGTLLTTLIPLADSLAVIAIKRIQMDYGRVRLWGSVAFILVSIGGGFYLEGKPDDAVLHIILLGSALMVISACWVPNLREAPRKKQRLALFELLATPSFVVFVLTAAVLQASHAALYGFATLSWIEAGIHKTIIGLLWAEGVVAEIALLACSGYLLRRLGSTGLFLLAGVAGILRWTVLGTTSSLPALFAVQALHALTFAGTLIASISYISQHVARDQAATAQGLYDGLAMGLLFGVAMAVAGWAYADIGPGVFYVMVGFSALGCCGALVLRAMQNTAKKQSASPPS
ncbi:MAG: MFS transporter [Rhodospirillales bacterium]|nr:MFS transporter [Rhodospirillales bacterium]